MPQRLVVAIFLLFLSKKCLKIIALELKLIYNNSIKKFSFGGQENGL